MAIFGSTFPLLLVGIFFVLRFVPDSRLNIPRRDYWFAPERRDETFTYLLHHSFWFACMALGFVMGLHFLIIQANAQSPAKFSTPMVLGLAACFTAGAIVWGVSMIRHFSQAA